jgi:predicted nucleic acid-binding protein
MIVLDASAVVELLLDTPAGRRVAARIEDPGLGIHAPHLLDVEATSALRRLERDGAIETDEAEAALDDLRALDLQRHSHEPLLDQIWALRRNLSACDATYVALADAMDATLVTCDAKLARASRSSGRIEMVR